VHTFHGHVYVCGSRNTCLTSRFPFEDVETVMVVLRKRVLNTLYLWIASRLCYLGVSTFVDFLNLLAVPRLGALLYTSRVLELHPSALFY
jgi:hypothetical protein